MILFSTTTNSFYELSCRSKNISVFLLLVFTLFSSLNLFSQTEDSQGWQLLKTEKGIEVYSQKASCEVNVDMVPFDYITFKVVNSNPTKSNINLQFEMYFEEGCNGCENKEETTVEITLNSGESIEGSCSNLENKLSYFISNPSFENSWHYLHTKLTIQLIN